MLTQFRLGEDNALSLWEPDMQRMPIVWTESVSNTLAHLRLQKHVVESVLSGADLSFPEVRESALICTRLGQSEGLVLERTEPSGADSGWFFGCRELDHDHNDVAELRRVSLYEAAVCYAPQVIAYLALPAGVRVDVINGVPAICREGELLSFKPESYLAAKHSAR